MILTTQKEVKQAKFMQLLGSLVRHAIRNQSLVINGYAELLKDELDDQKKARKDLDAIIVATDKMNYQIDLWKRYEQNLCKISWHSVGEIFNTCKKVLPEIKIVMDEEMGEIKIYTSPLIFEVFNNLIDNTIRHGKASQIKISYSFLEGKELLIIFADNGIGVPYDEKGKIFEKGFGKNTGMGLFLTREILDITDIKISEAGKPGEGARFEIMVPKNYYKI